MCGWKVHFNAVYFDQQTSALHTVFADQIVFFAIFKAFSSFFLYLALNTAYHLNGALVVTLNLFFLFWMEKDDFDEQMVCEAHIC